MDMTARGETHQAGLSWRWGRCPGLDLVDELRQNFRHQESKREEELTGTK
jgi:hypothetical protein